MAEFHHLHFVFGIDRHAVHAVFLHQEPLTPDLEIFRENAHGVVMLRATPSAGAGRRHTSGVFIMVGEEKSGGV